MRTHVFDFAGAEDTRVTERWRWNLERRAAERGK